MTKLRAGIDAKGAGFIERLYDEPMDADMEDAIDALDYARYLILGAALQWPGLTEDQRKLLTKVHDDLMYTGDDIYYAAWDAMTGGETGGE